MPHITLQHILDQAGEELQLSPAGAPPSPEAHIVVSSEEQFDSPSLLVGALNWARPSRIQLLGSSEISHLEQLHAETVSDLLAQLNAVSTRLIIVTDGCKAPTALLRRAKTQGIPVFTTASGGNVTLDTLHQHFIDAVRPTEIIHGVFMEVIGIGVLMTGSSGIGKSELALELLSRGHRLVADDAPEFRRNDANTISGTCPAAILDFIEVRGLGILNVRAMFGDSAIKRKTELRLIVDLKEVTDAGTLERVENHGSSRPVLGVDIPLVTIPVAPGRNIAVIVETAARNRILLNKGYNAAEAFRRQQRLIMERGES